MVEDVVGGCRVKLVDDVSVGQEDDAVRVARGHGVVGDHDDGLAQIGDGGAEECEQLCAGSGVESAGRLVCEDDLGS